MADIEEIRKKIDRLIEERGLNYRDVSLKIGRKDSYIQQYVRYGYPRRLKEIDRLRLANLLNIDDSEIMDDEVIATKTTGKAVSRPNVLSDFIEANSSPESSLIKLDVLNSSADCNNREEFIQNVTGKYFISKNIFEDITSVNPDWIKILKVSNDSMKPMINPGDSVWIDTSYNCPQADGLYVLINGKEPVIRQIQISPIDGSVEINSANASYKSYYTKNSQDVRVLGKIIYLGQKL